MGKEVEIKVNGNIYEIHLKEGRIGSIWRNRDGSITVKINPEYWTTPLKISGRPLTIFRPGSEGVFESVLRLIPEEDS